MTGVPNDLIPLPTAPYDERPAEIPLDVEECRTALWRCRGNVSLAAGLLKVPPARLRKFISGSPRLVEEQNEARQMLVDTSEDIAYEALTDPENPSRRDQMARFILTSIGKGRGYGSSSSGGANVNLSLPKGNLRIRWADGSSISVDGDDNGDNAKVIDHE
jgi:hypothetical protein